MTPMSFSDDVSSRGASLKVPLSSRIFKWNLGLYSGGVFPRDKTLHLSGWKRSCHFLDHLYKASRSSCRSCCPLGMSVRWYTFVSSAYITALESFLSASGRSLIYMTKSIGPNTDPWGIPLVTADHSEVADPTRTLCFVLSGSLISTWAEHLLFHMIRVSYVISHEAPYQRPSWSPCTLRRLCLHCQWSRSTHPVCIGAAGLLIFCQWIHIGVDWIVCCPSCVWWFPLLLGIP